MEQPKQDAVTQSLARVDPRTHRRGTGPIPPHKWNPSHVRAMAECKSFFADMLRNEGDVNAQTVIKWCMAEHGKALDRRIGHRVGGKKWRMAQAYADALYDLQTGRLGPLVRQ